MVRFFKQCLAWVLAFSVVIQPTLSYAAMITTTGRTDTNIVSDGNIYDITTDTIHGNTGFNDFGVFDVWADHTVNMQMDGMENLVNIVHDGQTSIDGILNSYQNGQIGGNVFFLNPNGIIVGESGVVNVGALTMMTPTAEFADGIVDADGNVSPAVQQAILAGDIPLTKSGLVSIKGNINATDGVGLRAGLVDVGGQIRTAFDTSTVVNTDGADLNNEVYVSGGRVLIGAESTVVIDGRIESNGAGIGVVSGGTIITGENSVISSSAEGNRDAGDVYINAGTAALFNPGATIAAVTDTGNPGDITIVGQGLLLFGGHFLTQSNNGKFGTVRIGTDTLEIAANIISNGEDYIFDADSITIKDGVIINTSANGKDSGDISLSADHNLTVENNVKLITTATGGNDAGNITLRAGDELRLGTGVVLDATATGGGTSGDITLSVYKNLLEPWWNHGGVGLYIGDNTTISGNNINITAEIDSAAEVGDFELSDIAFINNMSLDGLSETFKDFGDLMISGLVELADVMLNMVVDGVNFLPLVFRDNDLSSTINIGAATINAQNDLNISSLVNSEINVLFNVPLYDLSFAWLRNYSSSDIIIGSGANLTGDTISITSDINAITKGSSDAKSFIQELALNTSYAALAATAGMVRSHNTIDIKDGATLTATGGGDSDMPTVKIAATTLRETETHAGALSSTAYLGAAVNYYEEDVTVDVIMNGDIIASGQGADVEIRSELTGGISTTTQTIVGPQSETIKTGIIDTLTAKFKAFALPAKTPEKLEEINQKMGSNSKFGASAVVNYTDVKRSNANITIGGNITAGDNITIAAKNETAINSSASAYIRATPESDPLAAQDRTNQNKENGGAAALNLVEYNLGSNVSINSDANIHAGGNLDITSNLTVPVPTFDAGDAFGIFLDTLLGLKIGVFNRGRLASENVNITDYLVDEIEKLADRFADHFSTSGADSAIDVTQSNKDEAKGVGISGSVNIVDINANSGITVADGAKISAGKDVNIAAKTETFGFDLVGPIKLAGVQAASGAGASVGYTVYDVNTNVNIGKAIITAKNLNIDATTEKLAIMASSSGGAMDSYGFNGTFGYINSHTDTVASLDSGATLTLGKNLGLNAETNETYITIGGGVVTGAAVGIGASVALVDVVSNTRAYISGMTKPTEIDAWTIGGNLNLDAKQNNDIYNFTIAGSIATPETDGEEIAQNAPTGDASGQKYGVGVSGAAGYNSVSGTVEAYINNARINVTGNTNITALDHSAIVTVSGGATVRFDNDTDDKAGLAGAVSVNALDNKVVSARIENSTMTIGGNLNLDASANNSIIAISAGGSAAPKADASIAGSVSINEGDTVVDAHIGNSTIIAKDAVISANDDTSILAIAGAVGLGKKVGAGAAVGVNTIDSVVRAFASASTLTFVHMGISALTTQLIRGIGVAAGVAVGGPVGAGASVGVNVINSDAIAYIDGGTVNISGADTEENSALYVRAQNNADIDAGAGGIGVSAGDGAAVGIGIGTAVNTLNSNVCAYIQGTDTDNMTNITTTAGRVDILASADTRAASYVVGIGASTGDVGVAGSVGVSNINTNVIAYTDWAKITSAKNMSIASRGLNNTDFYGGAIGASKTVGVGGTVAFNGIDGNATTYAKNSDITTGGKLSVDADMESNTTVYSGTIGAAGTVGVAISGVTSDIDNSATAYTIDTDINSGDIALVSNSVINVDTYGGAGSGSGTVAGSAAVDVVLLSNKSKSYINGGTVESEKDILIKSETAENYDAIIASVSGAGNVAGAGNIIAISADSESIAYADNTTLVADDNVDINAIANTKFGDDHELGMGSGGGAGYVGLGGTLFVGQADGVARAFANDSHITAINDILISADLSQSSRMVMAAVGAGGAVGVGASVSAIDFGYQTESYVSETKTDGSKLTSTDGDIEITANTDANVQNIMVAAGAAGTVGVGGAVAVSDISGSSFAGVRTRNGATDGIELSAAKGNILVDANTTRGVRDYIVSGGASLMVGMAGSVSVVNYDSAITGEGMDAIGDAIDILNKNLADNDNTMDSGAARSGLFGDANFASNLQFVLDTVSDLDVSTVASLGDYTYVNAKSLSINATDTINNDQHAGGVSAALGISGVAVALGASVAYTGISGDATARIGDFSNITLTDDLNMESKVVINGSTNSYFGALAAGNIAVAVGGAVSVVDADINADTSVGKSVNIDTIGDASIVANSNVHLENMIFGGAVAAGVGAALGAGVGVVNIVSDIIALIDDNARIGNIDSEDTINALMLSANENTNVVSDIVAIGAGLAGLSANGGDVSLGGNSQVIVGNGATLVAGDMDIIANTARAASLTPMGVAVGVLGLGVNVARMSSSGAANVFIKDNASLYSDKTMNINADIKNSLYANVTAGSVGVLGAGGAEIKIDNTTSANILMDNGQIYTGDLDITAMNSANQDLAIFAMNAGLVNVSGLNSDNNADIASSVNINGFDINADTINILAKNDFIKDKYDFSLDSIGAGLIGAGVYSNKTNIKTNTTISIDNGTSIIAGGQGENGASLDVNAFNNIRSYDMSRLVSAGVAQGVFLQNATSANSNATVNIGVVDIKTSHDANFNTKTDADIDVATGINVFGAAAVVNGDTDAELTVNNNINFKNGADILSFGDLNIGLSSVYGQGDIVTKLDVSASTDIFNATAFSIGAGSGATGTLNLDSNLDVATGAILKSSGAIMVNALPGFYSVFGMLNKTSTGIDIAIAEEARDVNENLNSTVNVGGELVSGATNHIDIKIEGDATHGYTVSTTNATDTHAPASNEHNVPVDKNGNDVTDSLGDIGYIIRSEDQADNLANELANYQYLYGIYKDDPILGPAYAAEISRIQGEIERQGLRENAIRNTITFDDMAANRGHVYIMADNLTGDGKIESKGDANITIMNDSDMDLRLGDLTISGDYEGKIYFNGSVVSTSDDINAKNKTGGGASMNLVSATSGSSAPTINVENGLFSKKLELALGKTITNLSGMVSLKSMADIHTMGDIYAAQLVIDAKGAVTQSYTEGITHIAGDPASSWKNETDSFQNTYDGSCDTQGDCHTSGSRTSTTTKGSLGGGWYADSIYIAGRYINVNGTIQAGKADLNVTIPTDFQVYVPGIGWTTPQVAIAHNNGGNNMYDIQTNGGDIGAKYDAKNNKIYMADVVAQGGRIELYGTLMNTDANKGGKLVALDGYSAINITNNSSREIILGNIDNNAYTHGLIKITDIDILTGAATVTEFTFKDGQIHQNNVAIAGTGRGKDAVYNTRRGLRYTWGTGNEVGNRNTTLYQTDGWLWGAIDVDQDDVLSHNYEAFDTPRRLPDGNAVILDEANADKTFMANYVKKVTERRKREREWSKCGFLCFKKTYYYEVIEEETAKNMWSYSVKADYPIGISFIGYDTAQDINVTSDAGLSLGGRISSMADVEISTHGNVNIMSNMVMHAHNMTINAGGGIGDINNAVNIDVTGEFSANADGGNINVSAVGNLVVGNITASDNVIINANGSVVAANDGAVISGDKVDIRNADYIGTSDQVLGLSTSEVSASATGDIYLANDKSLAIDTVISTGGDVEITAAGDITNAGHEIVIDTRTYEAKKELWNKLQLFADAGWTEEMLRKPIRATNMTTPTDTWNEKAPNISGANVRLVAAGTVGRNTGIVQIDLTGNLTTEQRDILASAEAHNINLVRDEDGRPISASVSLIDDVNISASETLNITAGQYVYVGSNDDINLDHISAANGGRVTVYSAGSIKNIAADGEMNITGGDVYLGAVNGDIGEAANAIMVNATGISAGANGDIYINGGANDITVGDRGIWASGGDIRIATDGNIFAAESDVISVEGDTVELIASGDIGDADANVGVKATDIKATAGGDANLYLDADVVSDIVAGGELNLTSPGDIIMSDDATLVANVISVLADGDIDIRTNAPTLRDIISQNGDINVDSIYGDDILVKTVRAENGNATVIAAGGLDIGTAYAHDMLTIIAQNSITQSSGNGVTGRIVDITSITGGIGTKDNYFIINSDDIEGTYSLRSPLDIYATGFDERARVGRVVAGGDAYLSAADNSWLMGDGISDVNVVADNIWLDSATGGIGPINTAALNRTNAYAADGINLTNTDKDLLSDYIVNWRGGDIVLRNPTDDVWISSLKSAGGFKVILDDINNSGLEIMGADVKKLTVAHGLDKLYLHIPPIRFGWFDEISPNVVEYENLGEL